MSHNFDELAHVTRQLYDCRGHEASLRVEVDRLHRLIDSAVEDHLGEHVHSDEIDCSMARRVGYDPLFQTAQGHFFPIPPLGDRPPGIDDEAWDSLNKATSGTLTVQDARYLVNEIAGLRNAINEADRQTDLLREINERQRLRLRAVREVVEKESGEVGNRPESHRHIEVVSSAHVRWALDASPSDLAELRRDAADETAA